MGDAMKNLVKLLVLGALVGSLEVNAMVAPRTSDVNKETADLEKDVDKLDKSKLGPAATTARNAATQQLSHRYFELGLKPNKTAQEQQEFQEIGAELKARLGNAFSTYFNK